MGKITDAQDIFSKQRDQAIEEEQAVHELYCLDLLKRHALDPEHHRAEAAIATYPLSYLETLGYRVEHTVVPGTDKSELHCWKLFKIIDSSPKYRIKRVISIEEPAAPSPNTAAGATLLKGEKDG